MTILKYIFSFFSWKYHENLLNLITPNHSHYFEFFKHILFCTTFKGDLDWKEIQGNSQCEFSLALTTYAAVGKILPCVFSCCGQEVMTVFCVQCLKLFPSIRFSNLWSYILKVLNIYSFRKSIFEAKHSLILVL